MGKYQFGKSTLKGLGFNVVVKNSLTTHNYKKKQ